MVKSSVFILAACLCVHLNDASLCKPLSSFRIDCNNCICSKNGMEYSCSENECPPKHHENYDVKETEDGYKVLVPKYSNQLDLDYSKFVLNKKHRVPRIPDGYPYVNDEIPSSKESDTFEKENNNINKRENIEELDNDIEDKYNYEIDKKYKNENVEVKEMENNDPSSEEVGEIEDSEPISDEDNSNNNIEDDSNEEDDRNEEDDSNEDDDSHEDDDSNEDDASDEDGESDERVDSKNARRTWRRIIPSARWRSNRD